MNRTRYIPSIVMLTAAFVACIATIYNKYTTKESLMIILCTIVVFFVIGLFIKMIADKYLIIEMNKEINSEENNEDETVNDSQEEKVDLNENESINNQQ